MQGYGSSKDTINLGNPPALALRQLTAPASGAALRVFDFAGIKLYLYPLLNIAPPYGAFVRESAATMTQWDGSLVQVPSGVAAVTGARLATTVADGAVLGPELVTQPNFGLDANLDGLVDGWSVWGVTNTPVPTIATWPDGTKAQRIDAAGYPALNLPTFTDDASKRWQIKFRYRADGQIAVQNAVSAYLSPAYATSAAVVQSVVFEGYGKDGSAAHQIRRIGLDAGWIEVAVESVKEVIPTAYDTLTDGTPLQPKMQIGTPNGPVTSYSQYPLAARNTAYTVGQRVSAIASDNIERWYHCTASGSSAGSAPTFPTSGTVADGGVVWTYGGYHTIKGVLVEPGATNYAWPSGDSTHANYGGGSGLSATSATVLNEGTTLGPHYSYCSVSMSFIAGTTYSFSCEAKADTSTVIQLLTSSAAFGLDVWANFDLVNGVVGAKGAATIARITSAGAGRWICSITGAATVTSSQASSFIAFTPNNDINAVRNPTYTGTNKQAYIYWRQSEVGSAPTSYIPTTTATATRAATNLDMTIPARATDFTVVIKGVSDGLSSEMSLFTGHIDTSNGWRFKRNTANTGWRIERRIAGATTATIDQVAGYVPGEQYIVVLRVCPATGATIFSKTGFATDATWTSLPMAVLGRVGRDRSNSNYHTGPIQATFISRALTDEQCQALVNGTLQVSEVR